MSGQKIIDGLKEALAFAEGEAPAARIQINGYSYALTPSLTASDLRCPFCAEGGFDTIGLKIHISNGWCEAYEATALADPS